MGSCELGIESNHKFLHTPAPTGARAHTHAHAHTHTHTRARVIFSNMLNQLMFNSAAEYAKKKESRQYGRSKQGACI